MNEYSSITNIRQHLQDLQSYISYLEEENENLRKVITILTDGNGNRKKQN